MQLTDNQMLAATGALVKEIRWLTDHKDMLLEQSEMEREAAMWWLNASVDAYTRMAGEVLSMDMDQGVKDYLKLSLQTWETINMLQESIT